MHEIEVFICIDNNGDWRSGIDAADACANYEGEYGDLCDTEGHRVVKVKTKVALPVLIEVEAEAVEA